MTDESFMRMAIGLARKGIGYVNPNPLVGAVIVKDGNVIGEGWHARYGELHAERNALAACTSSPRGADIYVTLEPCCHYGKTPPCTDALIESGIARVFIGSSDPNPLVSGKGAAILREHGLEVHEHFLEAECDALNPVFFHYIQHMTPYVALKYAMTMDGKTACHTGASRWVTGEEARHEVQKLRHQYTGIMAGIGTVLSDDPLLTCRIENGRNPVRIICDTRLRIPTDCQLVRTAKDIPLIIATCVAESEKKDQLTAAGCECLTIRESGGHVDLPELTRLLGARGIDGILLEGGGTLSWSALNSGIVQKLYTFIAPRLFGGAAAKSPVEGPGVNDPSEAFLLKQTGMRQYGSDLCIESEVINICSPES